MLIYLYPKSSLNLLKSRVIFCFLGLRVQQLTNLERILNFFQLYIASAPMNMPAYGDNTYSKNYSFQNMKMDRNREMRFCTAKSPQKPENYRVKKWKVKNISLSILLEIIFNVVKLFPLNVSYSKVFKILDSIGFL